MKVLLCYGREGERETGNIHGQGQKEKRLCDSYSGYYHFRARQRAGCIHCTARPETKEPINQFSLPYNSRNEI